MSFLPARPLPRQSREYLIFEVQPLRPGRKTVDVVVRSQRTGYWLGTISWFGRWRQYVFEPEEETVWSVGCLEQVITKINELMRERKDRAGGAHA